MYTYAVGLFQQLLTVRWGCSHLLAVPGHVSDLLLLCPKHLCSDFITSPTALMMGKMRMWKVKGWKPHHKTSAELTVCALSLVFCSLNQSSLSSLLLYYTLKQPGTGPRPELSLPSIGEAPVTLQAQLVTWKLKASLCSGCQGLSQGMLSLASEQNHKLAMTEKGIQTLRSHFPGENMEKQVKRCC